MATKPWMQAAFESLKYHELVELKTLLTDQNDAIYGILENTYMHPHAQKYRATLGANKRKINKIDSVLKTTLPPQWLNKIGVM